MTRYVFPDAGAATRLNPDGRYASLSGLTVTVYTDQAGATPADIQTYPDGTTVAGSQVDAAVAISSLFYGTNDGATVLYASLSGGPIVPVYRNETAQPLLNEVAAGEHIHTGGVRLPDNVALVTCSGSPVDAVAGSGYGSAEAGALYVDTTGAPDLYLNTGDATLPVWTADTGTQRSGAGAPTDGVTAGDTDDFYRDTTAYGGDPATGWYRCTDGTAHTWAAFTGTVVAAAAAPTDGVEGTGVGVAGPGSLCLDWTTPAVYQCTGTKALPTWVAPRTQLGHDVVFIEGDGAPTDAVAGSGYGTSPSGGLYIDTTGSPDVYVNDGDAIVPAWSAFTGTVSSGAGAPTDGVTAGDFGDLYSDTTAYGVDPATGWYQCVDGDNDEWLAVAVAVISGAGAPTDGAVGTGAGVTGKGSVYVDRTTPGLYQAGGTKALPTWTAV